MNADFEGNHNHNVDDVIYLEKWMSNCYYQLISSDMIGVRQSAEPV